MNIDKVDGKFLQNQIKSVRQHLTIKQRIVVKIDSSSERSKVISRIIPFLRENVHYKARVTSDYLKSIYIEFSTQNQAASAVSLIENLLKYNFDSIPDLPPPERNGIEHPGTSGTDHYGPRDSRSSVDPDLHDLEDTALSSNNLALYLIAVLVILILIVIFY